MKVHGRASTVERQFLFVDSVSMVRTNTWGSGTAEIKLQGVGETRTPRARHHNTTTLSVLSHRIASMNAITFLSLSIFPIGTNDFMYSLYNHRLPIQRVPNCQNWLEGSR
jgi:uncharacterized membrane protein